MGSQQRDTLEALVARLRGIDGVSAYDEAGARTYTYDLSGEGGVTWGFTARPVYLRAGLPAEVHLLGISESPADGPQLGQTSPVLSVDLLAYVLPDLVADASGGPEARIYAAVDLAADIRGALELKRRLTAQVPVLSWSLQAVDGDVLRVPGVGVVAGQIQITHRRRGARP